jgi:hypothetical protein
LAVIGADLVKWEVSNSQVSNATRTEKAKAFLELVTAMAPTLTDSEKEASATVYADELRAVKNPNVTAVMKSNYLLLLRQSSLIDCDESIKKNLARIRKILNPMDAEQEAEAAYKAAQESYMNALAALETSFDAWQDVIEARKVREAARAADPNVVPGKAA